MHSLPETIDNPSCTSEISIMELPQNLTTYNHQIGGYNPDHKEKFKFLYDALDSTLYKVVSPLPKGLNEVRLYEKVFYKSSTSRVLLELRNFLPLYRGLFYSSLQKRYFIGMEDILIGLENPSACDIKMGRTTCLTDDCPAKIAGERAKYLWREKIGFFITGINVHEPETGTDTFFDISHGRSLDPSTIYEDGICLFLGKNSLKRVCLARAFLAPLMRLERWFQTQDQFHFYASSLLLAYSSSDDSTFPRVLVRLIDFTRWRAASDEKDVNFLVGIRGLIVLFRRVLTDNVAVDRDALVMYSCNNSSRQNISFNLPSPRESARHIF